VYIFILISFPRGLPPYLPLSRRASRYVERRDTLHRSQPNNRLEHYREISKSSCAIDCHHSSFVDDYPIPLQHHTQHYRATANNPHHCLLQLLPGRGRTAIE